jgi:hypothetical protein
MIVTTMTARNFKAMAHRSEGWWALEVTGDDLPCPAYTQVRRLDQAEGVVRDLLALHFGTIEDAVGQIEIVPVLDAALAEEVSQGALGLSVDRRRDRVLRRPPLVRPVGPASDQHRGGPPG